ncbi:hypothetical protein HPB48_004166 [Haemaphysalis longicornis]|uniref:Uncharacterized protein n=1 Tax=Haemaphysalis longicornis TaxID=44386 RepID=A0A9J6FUK6_HAELO|nr:hypothetical protein HPB48_004166 [Haemaphysalis longicornis]
MFFSTSYNVDHSTDLADLLGPSTTKQVLGESQENQEAEELENVLSYGLAAGERDIHAYVGGFLLKPILKSIYECNDCKAAVVVNDDKHSTSFRLKSTQAAGKRIEPSRAVV